MYHKKKLAYKIVLFFFVIFQLGSVFLLSQVRPVQAATSWKNAYVTLGNSRFSVRGTLNAAMANGDFTFTLQSSGNPDNNVGNVFPEDNICFNGSSSNGCKNNTTYAISNNPSVTGQVAVFTPVITGTMNAGDRVIATQSGVLTISFKPTTSLPSGAKILLTLPAASSNYADGIPDSAGFDAAALPADLTAGVCAASACFTPTSFTASAVALTSATTLHTIKITLSSAVLDTTLYSFTLGHASNAALRFLNPAPSGTTHTRGVADSLSAEIISKDSTEATIYDDTIMKVNPIDGVFVSATVEEALTYKINEASQGQADANGLIAGGDAETSCTSTTFTTTSSVNSTPTTVNFGSLSAFDSFYRAAQEVYVQTNTAGGFVVTVQYNNALKTAAGVNTIADGSCDGTCTSGTAAAWATAGNNGFGYTLGNISGSEAAWTDSDTYKIFANTPVTIMSKATQSTGSRVAVCYMLSVDTTQVAGYYFNKLTYIATPRF